MPSIETLKKNNSEFKSDKQRLLQGTTLFSSFGLSLTREREREVVLTEEF